MVIIESRMKRVGTTDKPTLSSTETCDHIFDFDEFGSTMPDGPKWHQATESLGIDKNSQVQVVEAQDVFCGPRLVYMFRSTGFKKCQSEAITIAPSASGFSGFVSTESVLDALEQRKQIIDVRSAARFSGRESDPRANVSAGHIPGSVNLHYRAFIDPTSPRQLLPLAALKGLFNDRGIDLSKPVIFTCGSGITACIGALAAIALGAEDVSVYDGSWSVWGADPSLPKQVSI